MPLASLLAKKNQNNWLYSDGYFETFVRNVLKTFPIGSDFVLGVADQVPPDANLSRVRMVRDIIDKTAG